MKKIALLLGLCLCLSVCGCRRETSRSATLYFMDTLITVTLYTEDDDLADVIFAECRTILTDLEDLWSRHREESEIARFNADGQGIDCPDARTHALLETALAVAQATDGAFDPTIAPLVSLWERCGEEDRLPTEQELSAVRGYSYLTLGESSLFKSDPAVQLDLGGIGKGAAISHLIDYLESCEVRGGLVSFGSNVAVFGEKPDGTDFRVALRDPKDAHGTVGTLTLRTGEILSVSGDYERYVTIGGARYHHILDPKTGYPADTGLASVALVAKDGAVADALSTALFVMGQEDAMAFYRSGVYAFEAVFVAHDGTVTVTDGLTDRFE